MSFKGYTSPEVQASDARDGLKLVREAIDHYVQARLASVEGLNSYGYSATATLDRRGYCRVNLNLRLSWGLRPDE